MAKLVKMFENGTIVTTLTIRGKDFTLTMLPWENGRRISKDKVLSGQVEERFADDPNIEEISCIVDSIDFGDEDDIEEALDQLSDFE